MTTVEEPKAKSLISDEQKAKLVSKKKNANFWPLDMRMKAVELYKQGYSVREIAKELKISIPAIYVWINKAGLAFHGKKRAKSKRAKRNKLHPSVSKVINDIRKEQSDVETHSLASDFGISANTDKETDSAIELKYCPCCGTNIKAVLVALQTCKELR